ncbi:MAG: hypothetical protein RBS91_05215 [Sulfurimonadaceae bacterium]|nr:hypothetical protein [Sulfurimonadaceae bacterium]
MLYSEWVEEFAKKHKAIVDKLLAKGYSDDEIIEYFDYENMAQKESDFCPLYKEGKKCHDIKELNCYLCGCPNFRYNDDGIGSYGAYKILSKCDINNGTTKGIAGAIHQDCSKCTVPHHRAYVKKHFDYDWKKIMKGCKSDQYNT